MTPVKMLSVTGGTDVKMFPITQISADSISALLKPQTVGVKKETQGAKIWPAPNKQQTPLLKRKNVPNINE